MSLHALSANATSTESKKLPFGFLSMLPMLALTLLFTAPAAGHLCYVDQGASSGAHDGTSWTNAYVDLQAALNDMACTEVWVAEGVYKLKPMSVRESFIVQPGTKLFGGFKGTETDLQQRVINEHRTILSGDIDSNDVNDDGNEIAETTDDIVGWNSFHVVVFNTNSSEPITRATIVDGFTITAGRHEADFNGNGAGMFCNAYGGNECSPSLRNLVFSGNYASYHGGALFISGAYAVADPEIINSKFVGNRAASGSAIYLSGYGGIGNMTIINSQFINNTSSICGAIKLYGTGSVEISASNFTGNLTNARGGALCTSHRGVTVITNTAFKDNVAGNAGGAIFNSYNFPPERNTGLLIIGATFVGNISGSGGALFDDGGPNNINPIIKNATFAGNIAAYGGAVMNSGDNGISSPSFINVTFANNLAFNSGGAMYNFGGDYRGKSRPRLINVIMWGNIDTSAGNDSIFNDGRGILSDNVALPIISYSIIQDSGGSGASWDSTLGVDGGGNIDQNPLLGVLGKNGGSTKTMVPLTGSPAVDNGTCIQAPYVDQRGLMRPQGRSCDIGAVEVNFGYSDRIFADGFATRML